MTQPQSRLAGALADRYRLERELGAGGMATVYLAHDLRHDRLVAVKVLRPELAAVIGAERFLAEIRTTANLQHPHILPLFDSGEAVSRESWVVSREAPSQEPTTHDPRLTTFLFYVMPYIEGESLRDRLTREKQLPVAEAIRIATEVASALDYAHRHGVVHRDIKPENVLLHDGSALVADFGIALAASKAGGSRMTETGMSLGTPHYMSPEQAMGEREVTARSDVYALGAMTYEMLVGDPPFTGSTAQAIVAKVVTEKPRPIHPQRDTVPAAVEHAVLTALQKLPADRFATAAEFATALHDTSAAPTRIAPAWSGDRRAPGWRERLRDPVVLGLAAIAVAAIAASAWRDRRAPAAPADVVRFTIPAPPPGPAAALGFNTVAVSPDGRMIVYIGQDESRREQLVLRPMEDIAARPLPGTDNGSHPFFSPDGRWVAFLRDNQLYRIAVDGTAPQRLATVPGEFAGASWSSSGVIVVSGNTALYLVPDGGGRAQRLGEPVSGELYRSAPLVLPDGRTVLYASWNSTGIQDAKISIASLSGGEPTVLDLRGLQPLGMVDGVLVYVTAGGLIMGAPVDLAKRRLLGPPVQLADQVQVTAAPVALASLSPTGTLVYQSGSQFSQVVIADEQGRTQALLGERREYAFPRLSPGGRQLALTIGAPDRSDVWLLALGSGTLTRLTTEGAINERPEWTPDGSRVLYRSDQGTRSAIWWRPADLSAGPTRLLSGDHFDLFEGVIAPDGRSIAYQLDTLGADLYARALSRDSTPWPIAVSSAVEQMPRISPDGRWIAFTTNESGVYEVVVQPFPGPGGRVQVSTNGGTEPVWSRDGRRLFYRSGGQFMAAEVRPGPVFGIVRRDTVFADRFVFAPRPHANYDVMPDGRRFVFLESAGRGDIVVASNWGAAVRARMGRGPAR